MNRIKKYVAFETADPTIYQNNYSVGAEYAAVIAELEKEFGKAELFELADNFQKINQFEIRFANFDTTLATIYYMSGSAIQDFHGGSEDPSKTFTIDPSMSAFKRTKQDIVQTANSKQLIAAMKKLSI